MKLLILKLILGVALFQCLPLIASVKGELIHIDGSVYTPLDGVGSIKAWTWFGMKATPKAQAYRRTIIFVRRKWHNVKPEIGWHDA